MSAVGEVDWYREVPTCGFVNILSVSYETNRRYMPISDDRLCMYENGYHDTAARLTTISYDAV